MIGWFAYVWAFGGLLAFAGILELLNVFLGIYLLILIPSALLLDL